MPIQQGTTHFYWLHVGEYDVVRIHFARQGNNLTASTNDPGCPGCVRVTVRVRVSPNPNPNANPNPNPNPNPDANPNPHPNPTPNPNPNPSPSS